MLDLNMFVEIAFLASFIIAQFTVIPQVVVSTSYMRVQCRSLISFIVALVTFEELDYVFSCAHSDILYGLIERVLELGVLGNLK